MSAMSDYLESLLRAHVFRTTKWAAGGTTIRVALTTGATADANTGATLGGSSEVPNSNAYARTGPDAGDANWSAASSTDGLTDNVAAITFPTCTPATWGAVAYMGIVDNATWGAGNVYMHGQLTAPKTVGAGDVFQFAIGALDVTFA